MIVNYAVMDIYRYSHGAPTLLPLVKAEQPKYKVPGSAQPFWAPIYIPMESCTFRINVLPFFLIYEP